MDAKAGAKEKITSFHSTLVDLSHRIHDNPELKFEEEKASQWLSEALSREGFQVEKGVFGLPTAFVARAGSGPLHIAICAEYDCLPAIGHACGHNLIATMSLGAAVAAAKVADEAGLTITVVGTPAEEGGNGKALLLERGAFEGAHAAMMVHPNSLPFDVSQPNVNAALLFNVFYTGKEAHAASFPEMGINAGDALTIAQISIGLLRQHLRPADRVHGFITKGGDAPNVIPAHTSANYMIRAQTLDQLNELRPRVENCFKAGALATGSRVEIIEAAPVYAHLIHDAEMAGVYQQNAEALGRVFGEAPRGGASTDMGNISLVLPSIHPNIGLNALPAVNHQPEMTAVYRTEKADRTILDGALAMAWTCIDLAKEGNLRNRLLARAGNPAWR